MGLKIPGLIARAGSSPALGTKDLTTMFELGSMQILHDLPANAVFHQNRSENASF